MANRNRREQHRDRMGEFLEDLKRRYPWPLAAPEVVQDWGPEWFLDNESMGHTGPLLQFVGTDTRVILELGSFVGRSTACFLRICPQAHVIAIDTWQGSPEHAADPSLKTLLPIIYEVFQKNLWEFRHRLTAIRETTLDGMAIVHSCGVVPDLIYVDADHATESVVNDILCARQLFPQARISGDDWAWDSVRDGVKIAAAELSLAIETWGTVWWLVDFDSHGAKSVNRDISRNPDR